MKRLSESMWVDAHKKNIGIEDRKENTKSNIKELQPVDMGGSVLWADRDLEIQGEYLIKYEDESLAEILQKPGWRLPTLNEVAELDSVEFNYDGSFHLISPTGELVFEKKGLFHHQFNKVIDSKMFYYAWTFNSLDRNNIHIFTFSENEGFQHSNPKSHNWLDQVEQNVLDGLCVRLVKDK